MQIKVNNKRKKGAASVAQIVPDGFEVMGMIETGDHKNKACLIDRNGVFYWCKNGKMEILDPSLCVALVLDRIQDETNFISSWP